MFDIYYKKNDNSKLFSYLSEKSENKVKNIKNFIMASMKLYHIQTLSSQTISSQTISSHRQ